MDRQTWVGARDARASKKCYGTDRQTDSHKTSLLDKVMWRALDFGAPSIHILQQLWGREVRLSLSNEIEKGLRRAVCGRKNAWRLEICIKLLELFLYLVMWCMF